MKEDEAALIIQKCIRRHLEKNRRRAQLVAEVDINSNNCDDEKLRAKKVLEEVNLFHKKLQSNLKKKEEMRKLCDNIDEVSSNLKAITKLEQCKQLETSFCDNSGIDRVKERHQEQIRLINLKWWEKLDIYEEA